MISRRLVSDKGATNADATILEANDIDRAPARAAESRMVEADDGFRFPLAIEVNERDVKTEGDLVVRLTVRPVPIEEVDRRSVVLIGGLIPVSGEGAPTEGRRLYVRSVGWVDHLVCIKGVPI